MNVSVRATLPYANVPPGLWAHLATGVLPVPRTQVSCVIVHVFIIFSFPFSLPFLPSTQLPHTHFMFHMLTHYNNTTKHNDIGTSSLSNTEWPIVLLAPTPHPHTNTLLSLVVEALGCVIVLGCFIPFHYLLLNSTFEVFSYTHSFFTFIHCYIHTSPSLCLFFYAWPMPYCLSSLCLTYLVNWLKASKQGELLSRPIQSREGGSWCSDSPKTPN